MTDVTEIETLLAPPDATVSINGKIITVKPFTFGQLPRVLKLLSRMNGESVSTDAASLIKLFADHGDEIIDLIAYCINEPRDNVASIPQTEAINLVTKFIEVNSDFFIQTVLPMITGKVAALKLKAGQQ